MPCNTKTNSCNKNKIQQKSKRKEHQSNKYKSFNVESMNVASMVLPSIGGKKKKLTRKNV